jgi:hypothetical protein
VTTAPMTRAQKFQWHVEKGLAEGIRPLPDRSESVARGLVAAVQRRFEVLRTSIDEVNGVLCQRRHASGAELVVHELGSEAELETRMAVLAEAFRTGRQGRPGELLARFHLLRTARRGWLGMVADNVAVDAAFHLVIDQEISRILGEPVDGPLITGDADGIQPFTAAAVEAGPQGERERRRAAELLRRHFAVTAPRMHRRRPPREIHEGRYYRGTLTLSDADRLCAGLIARTTLLPSALVLAAFTQLMSWRNDQDACPVNVSVSNRHTPDLRLTLGATAQRVPIALTGTRDPLLAFAGRVQQTLSDGHPVYGRYDPDDLLAERADAQRRRGACLGADLAFNFVPPPQGWTALVEPGRELGREPGPALGVEPAISGSTTDEVSYEYAASLSVRWADARTARLSVHGDADALPPGECERLLRGIGRSLVRLAAGHDCEAAETAEAVGLTARAWSAAHVRLAGRWIDPGLVARRLLDRDHVAHAEVTVDTSDGAAPRLVAHVVPVPGAVLSPADLRAGLLPALDSGDLLIIPERYVVGAAFRQPAAHLIEAAERDR